MASTAVADNAGQVSPSRSGALVSSWMEEEECVLRECLYALQGISGERIRFIGDDENSSSEADSENSNILNHPAGSTNQAVVTIQSKAIPQVKTNAPRSCSVFIPPSLCHKSRLGSGALDAINRCAEAGWLYRRLQRHLERTRCQNNNCSIKKKRTASTTTGSIQRAFARALQLELQSYQQFLAQHLQPTIATATTTLRHLLIAMQAPMHRLTILAAITDGMSHLPGPDLLHALHMAATRHGDTRHQLIAETLLAQASRPWLDRLYLWTTEGVLLDDPVREFFVQMNTSGSTTTITKSSSSSTSNEDCWLWTDRYRLDDTKVPRGILESDLVEPAFMVGKGINFIRKCLLDGEWTLQLTTTTTTISADEAGNHNQHMTVDTTRTANGGRKQRRQEQLGFVYTKHRVGYSQQCSTIRKTLLEATSLVHSHILTSLHAKHGLMNHLFALKQFLLLGQGDFFSALMDGIHSEYENKRGIVGVYRHSLAAIVETALRNTNANGFPPDILGRLEVELLLDPDDDVRYQFGPSRDSSKDDPRSVWDIFVLEYRVPDPVLSIVHPKAVVQYRQMFLFLFGLRKIEFLLNLTWRQSAVLQHEIQTTAQHNGQDVSNSPEYAQSLVLLRQVAMTRQAMMHFVVNIKSYLMFEVLEGRWNGLQRDMQASETLDEAIQSHDEYLEGICRTSLLAGINPSSTSSQGSLSDHVKDLLDLTDKFCSYQQHVFGHAIEAAERAARKRRVAELRTEEGRWGFSSEKERDEEGSFFGLSDERKMADLNELSTGFNNQAVEFLRVLDFRLNGGPVMEELAPGTPSNDDAVDDSMVFDDKGDAGALRFLAFQLDCNKFFSLRGSSSG